MTCTRFTHVIHALGMNTTNPLHCIHLDYHLLTMLVEIWLLQINTFHFPIKEMTEMLQDIACITELCIDEPTLVGHYEVGEGKRWQS